jgi:hypothetical protein
MFDQAPEHRRFKFRSGFLVNGHDRLLARCLAGYPGVVRRISMLSGELSQILPYRSANRIPIQGNFGVLYPKLPLER